ncbi:hypothetical protein CYLTODRAFT_489612 [Cylindrobasidium torrendii FP15055 ss-10]|uniref:Uncharacterized protein n=1 Tax=Cylindrobasidium torrendii FP15055 ss-10 TaxID=1314674 RepID=A0A0D7BDH4_9AGAR|nr:hypothetical protein CYLTODRAFT_489612 [Cylindrobasidium torrendii FP15055 ss-10]
MASAFHESVPLASPIWQVRVYKGYAPSVAEKIRKMASHDPDSKECVFGCSHPNKSSIRVYVQASNMRSDYWLSNLRTTAGVVCRRGICDISRVPLGDVCHFQPASDDTALKADTWVRVLRHELYAGDIGFVCTSGRIHATVLLLPRIHSTSITFARAQDDKRRPIQVLLPTHNDLSWPSDLVSLRIKKTSLCPATHIDPVTARLFRQSKDYHVIAHPPWACLRPTEWTFQPGEYILWRGRLGHVTIDNGLQLTVVLDGEQQEEITARWDHVTKQFHSGDAVTTLDSGDAHVIQVSDTMAHVLVKKVLADDREHPQIIIVPCNSLTKLQSPPLQPTHSSVVPQAILTKPPAHPLLGTEPPPLPMLSRHEDVIVTHGRHKGWHGMLQEHLPGYRVLIRLDKYGATRQFEHVILPRASVQPAGTAIYRKDAATEVREPTPIPEGDEQEPNNSAWDPNAPTPDPTLSALMLPNHPMDFAHRNFWLLQPVLRGTTIRAKFKTQFIPVCIQTSDGQSSFTRTYRGREHTVDPNDLSFEHPGRRHRCRFLVIHGPYAGQHARPTAWEVVKAGSPQLRWYVRLVTLGGEGDTDTVISPTMCMADTDLVVAYESATARIANQQLAHDLMCS